MPWGQVAAEEPERKITMIEKAKHLNARAVRKAARSESEKNSGGGYNAHPNVVDCFAAMEYRYTGGRYENEPIRFRLCFPDEIKPGKKYPLVVWFHGKGESGDENTRQLSHVQSTIQLLAGKEKLDFFLLATQCPEDNPYWNVTVSTEGQGDAPMTVTREIFDAVIREFPVDENRLGVFGLCSGGDAAWEFVADRPGRFSSLVVCSSMPVAANADQFRNTAIWAFNNKDDTAPYETVERMVDAINDSGGRAHLTLKETGGHDAWTNALANERVIGWMILQDLRQGGPPPGVLCYHRSDMTVFLLFGLPVLGILIVTFRPRRRSAGERL